MSSDTVDTVEGLADPSRGERVQSLHAREGYGGGARGRGDGWNGSRYRRPGALAPAAPVERFDDNLEDIGR